MKTKHTLGEWIIVDGDLIESQDGYPIASIFDGNSIQGGEDAKAIKANAKLIAAAPEMLEVLKSSMPYLEQFALRDILNKAKSVIKKATE